MNKIKLGIMYVLSGMLWGFGYGMSETKITDMWFLPMGVMIMFHGLEKIVEDNDAATARLVVKIANTSMVVAIGLIILSFIFLRR